MPSNELKEFIHQLPKAELHIHLEGAITPETVLKLAKQNKMQDTLPAKDVDGLRKWFQFSGFDHFVSIYVTIQNLLRTPDDFALIAYDLGADMYRQNILYRETTFTPHTHIDYQHKGLTIQDILSGLDQGRQQAHQDFGVEIRWVFDIYRNLAFINSPNSEYNPEPAEKTLLYAQAGLGHGVVGFGIGGNEVGAPSAPFQETFLQAKQSGLLSVPHAGETMGAESVWEAVRVLQADRIGHGVRSIEDPELIEYLRDYHITLEVNPTSNLCLHVYDSIKNHPFQRLDQAGILVTINTDDPPLFNTTLLDEYALIADAFGYGKQDLARFTRNAFLATGADLETKQSLLENFDSQVTNLL
ncbi:MAG: adenosine deaminase [Anaerolineales bacterium]|nr:adenosine deaminase [Anaerolineales bacterium]